MTYELRPANIGLHTAWRRAQNRCDWRTIGTCNTSSSAVAKRLRDASCLSVVSLDRTKRRAQSFIGSYIMLQIYDCVQLNVVLLSLA